MGRTSSRARPETRRHVQAAARRLFAERGFFGATVHDIARQADLSVGAIYMHFRSKEDLFVSLFDDAMESFRADLRAVLRRSAPPLERLREVWNLLIRLGQSRPESHRVFPLLHDRGIQRWVSTDVLREINRAAGRAFRACSAVLREGIREGVFRPHDPRAMADLIWAMFVGTVQLQAARENLGLRTAPIDAVCAEAWETFETGLLAR